MPSGRSSPALNDCGSLWRSDVACALGKIGDNRAVEPLVAALKDSRSYVRSAAACALGKIGDNRAVEPLVAALKDNGSEVRSAAACALDSLQWKAATADHRVAFAIAMKRCNDAVAEGEVAFEPLIESIRSDASEVRSDAIRALGKLGDARAVEPLISAFKNSRDKHERCAAMRALGKLGDARALTLALSRRR